jgi:aminopeptidase C
MKKIFLLVVLLTISFTPFYSQKKASSSQMKVEEGLTFSTEIDLKTTPVKNQARTNTCWSFATTSFMESEIIRTGKAEDDLSEMYVIRDNYINRLHDSYLKQGKGNPGEGGGLPHDWLREVKEAGIVPETVYPGLNYGSKVHNHDELQAFITAIAAVPVTLNHESPQYYQIVNGVLDAYLGRVPETFLYNGIQYTPQTYAENLGIHPDDYIEVSSYTHFPFYSQFVLEVPDNWAMEKIYNVPLDELVQIIDFSLTNGYTLVWDGDISERGFSPQKGVAIIPETSTTADYPADIKVHAENMTPQERMEEAMKLTINYPEVKVTQQMRQEGYENSSTTDDHAMHVTGLAKDQYGKKYYKIKNSWGTDSNPYGGYLFMSEPYIRAKTILIMVNKNAVPPVIKTKLGI